MQGELRCLDPHVLSLLGQVQCAALPQAALAPAALLMEELHGKLVEAMTRARRPSFLNAAAAQDEPTGHLLPTHTHKHLHKQALTQASTYTSTHSRQTMTQPATTHTESTT